MRNASRDRLQLFARRAGAYWVDCTLAFAIVASSQVVLLTPLREAIGIDDASFRDGWHTQGYTLVTISLPVWCFFALFEGARRGATPGKRLLRLRVRDARAASGDDPIGIPRAFVRTVVKLLPWELAHLANNLPVPMWYADDPDFRILFAASGIALTIAVAMALFAPRGRTPHDLASGSIVTRI